MPGKLSQWPTFKLWGTAYLYRKDITLRFYFTVFWLSKIQGSLNRTYQNNAADIMRSWRTTRIPMLRLSTSIFSTWVSLMLEGFRWVDLSRFDNEATLPRIVEASGTVPWGHWCWGGIIVIRQEHCSLGYPRVHTSGKKLCLTPWTPFFSILAEYAIRKSDVVVVVPKMLGGGVRKTASSLTVSTRSSTKLPSRSAMTLWKNAAPFSSQLHQCFKGSSSHRVQWQLLGCPWKLVS